MTTVIIGGGASGMMAAVTAAERFPEQNIILLERQARVGKKLLATGNGRCNLSNRNLSGDRFHGADPSFCLPALRSFQPLDWFRERGLLMVTEPSGRVYPLSDSANSVLDVLRFSLSRPNLDLRCGCEVRSVKRVAERFCITCVDGEAITADRLIVACGGLAGTKLGGSMSGYQILRSLGHKCSKLHPALVQVNTEDTLVKALKGVRADGAVRVYENDRLIAQSEGEIQFTMTGVSGPAVFEISRAVSAAAGKVVLELNLLRGYSRQEILDLLAARRRMYPELPCEELLTGMLHNRLGKTLLRCTAVEPARLLRELSDHELETVAEAVSCFRLQVTGTMGMDCAQVTAGGILTAEFDENTLESRLCPNLFACGEVLDIDGDCGGYNLHWAWCSGRLAGMEGTYDPNP